MTRVTQILDDPPEELNARFRRRVVIPVTSGAPGNGALAGSVDTGVRTLTNDEGELLTRRLVVDLVRAQSSRCR